MLQCLRILDESGFLPTFPINKGGILATGIKDKVNEKISPIIESLGYEVVDVEYSKKSDGMNLTFYIDKPSGITLDDCEKVHRAIDGPLDELNPTGETGYVLNVSSPGLDRPLKTTKDFDRNMGKKIEIKLFAPIEGKKVYEGKLVAFDESLVRIETDAGILELPKNKIAHITPSFNI